MKPDSLPLSRRNALKGASSAWAARIDVLQFISTTHRNEFDRRRRYEWQTLIATLTFYVLAAAAALKGEIPVLTAHGSCLYAIAIAAALGVCSIMYLHYIQCANSTNKSLAESAEDCLIGYVGRQCFERQAPVAARRPVNEKSRRRCGSNWSWYWQASVIVLFAGGSAAIVISHSCSQTANPAGAVVCTCSSQ